MPKKRLYQKEDFEKGDFILFRYTPDAFAKGEIVKLNEHTAIIEIALPMKKNDPIETEQFEVEYIDLVPISAIISEDELREMCK